MDPSAPDAPGLMRDVLDGILALNQSEDAPPESSEAPGEDGLAHARTADVEDDAPSDSDASTESPAASSPSAPGLAAVLRDAGLAKPADEQAIPERFGRYIVLGVLGRGGMGLVLEAFDRSLDRKVAVKLLHQHLGGRHTQRLIREAKALARLSHPNVVQVHEVGTEGEHTFVAMELASGQTLQRWQSSPRPWAECVRVYTQAGRGLEAAHAKGLVHRDFKPGNCILDPDGRVRVLDFGLVRDLDAQSLDAPPSDRSVGSAVTSAGSSDGSSASSAVEDGPLDELTRTGTVLGTLAYMAPEQLDGQPVDARADQFSFCASLHEALYGQRPFAGDTVNAYVDALRHGRLRAPPRRSGVPARLHAVIVRGLAHAPEDRWPSMTALLDELSRIARSRLRWWAAGAAVLAGTLAVGAAIGRDAEVCGGAQEQIDRVWNESRRAEVEAAILGTELSYAGSTWERVAEGLDAYAQTWAAKHEDVCHATNVRKEQSAEVMDLRNACLMGRLNEFREAVQVLTEANDTRVERAVHLVRGLPELERCDDVAALKAEVPPPEDPKIAREVQRLREQLVRARTLQYGGEYEQAVRIAIEVMAAAEALGYRPLLAEAALRRGASLERRGEYDEAEQQLRQAHLVAVEHGHTAVASEAAAKLAFVVGSHQARHEQGRQWAETALAFARGTHADPLAEARALNALGGVIKDQGDLDQALTHYRRALDLFETHLDPGHPIVATPVSNIGVVLGIQGDLRGALAHHRRALEIFEESLGPSHPQVALALGNIGVVLRSEGKFEESLEHQRRALEIQRSALGEQHPDVANRLNGIGSALEGQGELSEALSHYRQALAIREQALGAEHPSTAASVNNIGVVLLKRGQAEQSLHYHRRALALWQEALEPGHRYIGMSLGNIGTALCALEQYEEALEHQRRALQIREQALGAEHPEVALSLHSLGLVEAGRGRLRESLDYHQRALSIKQKAYGEQHPDVAESLGDIGDALLAQGQQDEALEHHQRALEIRERAFGEQHGVVAESLHRLGVVWLARGEAARALQYQQRALAIFEEVSGPSHRSTAKTLLALGRAEQVLGQVDSAREHIERALPILATSQVTRATVADARFALATLLGPDTSRAVELARQAEQAYAMLGDAKETQIAEVRAWLDAHDRDRGAPPR